MDFNSSWQKEPIWWIANKMKWDWDADLEAEIQLWWNLSVCLFSPMEAKNNNNPTPPLCFGSSVEMKTSHQWFLWINDILFYSLFCSVCLWEMSSFDFLSSIPFLKNIWPFRRFAGRSSIGHEDDSPPLIAAQYQSTHIYLTAECSIECIYTHLWIYLSPF